MSFPERKPESLHGLEVKISHFLKWGVLTAGLLILTGWLMLLFHGQNLSTQGFKDYNPQTLSESFEWALVFKDQGMIISFLGLMVLLSLPVIRVFLTGLLFLRQREFRMAAMTFAVFLFLIGSFFLGVEH